MSNFKKHPDGYKSYLGRDDKGLYSVRIKWAIYAANANGSVLYEIKDGVKKPLNVEQFKAKEPKIFASLMRTLARMRCDQSSLPFSKIGRRVSYKKKDVLKYEQSKTVLNTAQLATV
ncbi:hypothetical protein [Acinetobacter baumannii]|nr:hypothetical protein [Acinetobacter baumannii]